MSAPSPRCILVGLTAALLALPLLTIAALAPKADAQPDDRRSPCAISVGKWADPTRLFLGDWTTVTLTSTTNCPAGAVPLHVILSIDGSLSMNPDSKLDNAKRAAKQFVQKLDFEVSKVGVTSFSDAAYVETELTDSMGRVLGAIDGIDTEFGTVIADGLDLSREMLIRGRRDTERESPPIEAIIILSDGRPYFNTPAQVMSAASKIKAQDILLISICVGSDCDTALMRSIASRPNLFFDVRNSARLIAVYNEIVDELLETDLRLMEITDIVPDNMRYVEGSSVPEVTRFEDNTLYWRWSVIPRSGITITYQLEPLETGVWPTNVEARGQFRDTQNRIGEVIYPVPTVEVIAPTPTPTPTPTNTPTLTSTPGPTPTDTPTPTNTATNTPVPRDIYLPIALNEHCDPIVESTDVALVIDISTSMDVPTQSGGLSKREAAWRAARIFAEHATGPGDQVAVIAFASEARVLAPLGSDADAVRDALHEIPRSEGTRIDAGLRTAIAELSGPARAPENRSAILLLTDGRPTRSTAEEVVAAAGEARAAGILVYAVGLGADVDPALLRLVAGADARYVAAPRAEDLERIYEDLARIIPCPTGRHDWSRPWP